MPLDLIQGLEQWSKSSINPDLRKSIFQRGLRAQLRAFSRILKPEYLGV